MKDHAVVCCRFAFDCAQAMDSLSKELASIFGSDTEGLAMRFGIHRYVLRAHQFNFYLTPECFNSGPVAAGKWAFQVA